ncbi:MAG TPA: hypothetical protein VGC41_28735 [Kofleriaceae bacterium]
MSTSTTSKPESEPSPAAGSVKDGDAIEVELEQPRQRLVSWAIFGVIFGALLVWKLGTVGVWAGWVLIALGLFRGFQLAQTFIYPAGTIKVSDTQVVLPRRIHRPNPLTLEPSKITAVYFLRRSVPMYHAAPVLVVEVGDQALLYPRDWFATEADQRHVVHALLKSSEPA